MEKTTLLFWTNTGFPANVQFSVCLRANTNLRPMGVWILIILSCGFCYVPTCAQRVIRLFPYFCRCSMWSRDITRGESTSLLFLATLERELTWEHGGDPRLFSLIMNPTNMFHVHKSFVLWAGNDCIYLWVNRLNGALWLIDVCLFQGCGGVWCRGIYKTHSSTHVERLLLPCAR